MACPTLGPETWSPAVGFRVQSIKTMELGGYSGRDKYRFLVSLHPSFSLDNEYIYPAASSSPPRRNCTCQALSLKGVWWWAGVGEDKVRWMPTQRYFQFWERFSLNSAIQAVTQSSNSKCLLWFKCWGTRMDKMWSLDLSVGVWESIGCSPYTPFR